MGAPLVLLMICLALIISPPVSYTHLDRLEKELLAQNAKHKDWACTEAVSYTHLDVYKRQVLYPEI